MTSLLAIAIDPPVSSGRTLSQNFPTLGNLLNTLLKNSFTLIGLLFLALLIFGGVTYIIGAGGDDPKKAAAGQKAILNALIGFCVVFLAYFIIQIVEVITGLHILNSNL